MTKRMARGESKMSMSQLQPVKVISRRRWVPLSYAASIVGAA